MRSLGARGSVRRCLLFLLLAPLACHSAPSIPTRDPVGIEHGTDVLTAEQSCDLWTSYQIEVESIDDVRTNYRPSERCVYYRVTLPAGDHVLELRLNYFSPTHHVRTAESVRKTVTLSPGQPYTLFDLTAGADGERLFTPWVESGAPADEVIELVRPGRPKPGSSRPK